MLSALLATIVPTFGIIFIGWLARKIGIWGSSSVDVLNNYAYYIALPALIFWSIVTANLGETFNRQDALLLVGVLAAHLIVFLLLLPVLRIKKISKDTRATLPMLVTFGSTAYLGIPYATFAFGQEGTVYSSLLSVALVTVILFASILVLNRFSRARVTRNSIRTLLELPFLWAVLLGILWPVFRLPNIPMFLGRFIEILSDSAGPTALLGLGTFLYNVKPQNIPWRTAVITSFLKVTVPTVATFFVLDALGVGGVRLAVGVAMAGTSSAVTCFILSEQYELGERLTAGTILLSTFFSLAVLSLVSVFWIQGGIF
jgi:malonate transporter and related proteins